MASSVFYKWASRKDESRVTFDGTGITVFDLKREIIIANNLVKGTDFDVHVYDAATNQGQFVVLEKIWGVWIELWDRIQR